MQTLHLNQRTETGDTRYMGTLINGLVFVAKRDERKHLYRGGAKTIASAKNKMTASWGVDEKFLTELEKRGAKIIVISDTTTKISFWMPLKRLLNEGFLVDLGHGEQRHLPYHSWNRTDDLEELIKQATKVLRRGTL